MKSCTRRATFTSFARSIDRPKLIGITLMVAMVCGISSTRGEESSPPDPLIDLSLPESAYAPGFVLPLDEPGLGIDQRSLAPAVDLTNLTTDLEAGSAEPIAVPLPPGVATGMIGLASVAIARYRWRIRRT